MKIHFAEGDQEINSENVKTLSGKALSLLVEEIDEEFYIDNNGRFDLKDITPNDHEQIILNEIVRRGTGWMFTENGWRVK